jgi:ABC-2 type transport system ATP-binding protein
MAAIATLEPPVMTARSSDLTIASLRSVTKKYGQQVALSDFSIELLPGEVVALLGPNGAGKTTAVRLLLGLSEPNKGEARIFGGNPRERCNRERLGAMLQVGRMWETLKVREHLKLFRSYYPHPRPVDELLAIAGLVGLEDRLFGKLSGGEKQRMLFALALSGDPDLIFLDEPTLGMDVEARRLLWKEVRKLSAAGKTVLLTTHYLEEADALASRIVVMQQGRVVAEGTPAELKAAQGARTIRCISKLDGALVCRLQHVLTADRDGKWLLIRTDSAESVLRELLHLDDSLSELEVHSAGLEETFLALTSNNQKSVQEEK